jgi:predicted transposase YdaD
LDDDHKQSLYLLLGQQLGEQAEKPTFVEGSRQQALQQLGQTVERILTETGMTEDELVSHLLDE